jgi:hypothetical protein
LKYIARVQKTKGLAPRLLQGVQPFSTFCHKIVNTPFQS